MRLLSLGSLLALVAVIGCGDSDGRLPAVPAKGTVLYKGKPAGGVLVVFHPTGAGLENAAKPVATTKDDGTFVLTTYEENDGAPVGDYSITLVWNQKGKEKKFSLGDEGGGGGVDKLGGRYGNPKNALLKQTVRKGEPNDFKLEVE